MAQERALFPNDPPQDGDQFTIGNTTYAWDPTPGIWRAFTTATSSSSGGGGGGVIFSTELITTSDAAWSPKFDGTFTFIAVGSGGTGGIISLDDGGSSGATRAAYSNSGGGAAGAAILTVNGLTSQTYDITIAASVTNTVTDRTQVGGPGNDTTITGNGVDITAGAGQGGTVTVRATSAGGIGGTATGGDTNIPGGAADDATSGRETFGGIIFSGIMPGNGADTNELNGFGGGGGGNYTSRNGRPGAASSTSEPGAVLVLYWTGGGTTGGASTTVNIGGGGAGLQLGVTAKDTITTSITITANDLNGTGPAWVMILGGGGSGSTSIYNSGNVNYPAAAGGAGASYGFFLNDVADLVGATFTAGAGAPSHSITRNVSDGTTISFGNSGTNGGTSTLVLNGTTYALGGGTAGIHNERAPGTAGTAGTATATGGTPLTEISVADMNTDTHAYWSGFIVDFAGALRFGNSNAVTDVDISPPFGGGGGTVATTTTGVQMTATAGAGNAGSLQIVYQNQA